METVTLASIYELQGLESEAIEIYKKVLQKDPSNKDAIMALERLGGNRKTFSGVNNQMKDFFVSMHSDIEYLEFERWLLKIWR